MCDIITHSIVTRMDTSGPFDLRPADSSLSKWQRLGLGSTRRGRHVLSEPAHTTLLTLRRTVRWTCARPSLRVCPRCLIYPDVVHVLWRLWSSWMNMFSTMSSKIFQLCGINSRLKTLHRDSSRERFRASKDVFRYLVCAHSCTTTATHNTPKDGNIVDIPVVVFVTFGKSHS